MTGTRCQVLFAGTLIGMVDLDGGEPAAGYLEPWPGYARVAAVFRRAGNALWAEHVERAALPGIDAVAAWLPPAFVADREARGALHAEAAAGAAAHAAFLALATEAGHPMATERLELWDASVPGERPFILATFGPAPAPVFAVLPPRAERGGDEHDAPDA